MRLMLSALLVTLVCGSESPWASPVSRRGTSELTRGFNELFAEWDTAGSPGAAVALTDGGEIVLTRCYGLADIEHGILITPKTRFELASVSKPFTAFAILLLEQSGKLALSDEIHDHLPELPDYGSPITLADLVHHTSGLSDWTRVRPYAGEYGRAGFGITDLLSLVARQRVLEFEPGTKWSYANTNYALLAEIVARVTETPFGEWMRENVFEPLGMYDTSFPIDGARILPDRANAYYRESDKELVRSLVGEFEIPGPAHAFSTIDDMARWIDNFRTGRVGGLALIEKMTEKPTLTTGQQSFYAAGLGMGSYRGVKTAGHSGQTGAFKTELVYCPDIEVGIVVLGNAGWMQPAELARGILDLYLQDELEPLREAADGTTEESEEAPDFDPDPAEYDRFLGGYRLDEDPSVLIGIARERDWLVGVIVGEGLDLFRPVAPSEFENRHQNCRLTFLDLDGHGDSVERVRITLRGEARLATRVQGPPDPAWLDECTGFYYSDELQTAYEIVRDSDGLAVHRRNSRNRPLHPADTDILVGGIGVLTFQRGEDGHIIGFDFGEPEDLGERSIRFLRRGQCR